jgi:hypothetical protein
MLTSDLQFCDDVAKSIYVNSLLVSAGWPDLISSSDPSINYKKDNAAQIYLNMSRVPAVLPWKKTDKCLSFLSTFLAQKLSQA